MTTTQQKSVNWRWRIISLGLALALVLFMLSQVEWAAFWDVLARLSPTSLVLAFLIYVALNLFRSLRYITLLDQDLPVLRVFPIALYHNFLVRLLPFKLGEVAYVVLMQQRLNVSVKAGVSSLFSSRLLELLVIVLVAAASLLLSGEIIPNQGGLALVLVVGCLVGGVLGFYFMGTFIRLATSILRWISSAKLVENISSKLDSLALEFDRLRQPRLFLKALFWSCFTYSCSFAVNAVLLHAIGIQPDPVTLVVLVSLGMFATAFPFNISGFGAVELSWAFGLTTLLGYSMGEATSVGLMLNGYQLICAGISGLIGYLVVQSWRRI